MKIASIYKVTVRSNKPIGRLFEGIFLHKPTASDVLSAIAERLAEIRCRPRPDDDSEVDNSEIDPLKHATDIARHAGDEPYEVGFVQFPRAIFFAGIQVGVIHAESIEVYDNKRHIA